MIVGTEMYAGIISFIIIEIALIIIPILYFYHRNKLVKTNKKFFFLYIIIVFGLILKYQNISFFNIIFDSVSFFIFYASILFPLIYTFEIKNKFRRIIVQTITFTPVVFVILFGSLGVIGVMMAILQDLVPEKEESLRDKVYYREFFLGGPLADEDFKIIKIYKQFENLPLLEKKIYEKRFSFQRLKGDSVSINISESKNYFEIQIYNHDNKLIDTSVTKN